MKPGVGCARYCAAWLEAVDSGELRLTAPIQSAESATQDGSEQLSALEVSTARWLLAFPDAMVELGLLVGDDVKAEYWRLTDGLEGISSELLDTLPDGLSPEDAHLAQILVLAGSPVDEVQRSRREEPDENEQSAPAGQPKAGKKLKPKALDPIKDASLSDKPAERVQPKSGGPKMKPRKAVEDVKLSKGRKKPVEEAANAEVPKGEEKLAETPAATEAPMEAETLAATLDLREAEKPVEEAAAVDLPQEENLVETPAATEAPEEAKATAEAPKEEAEQPAETATEALKEAETTTEADGPAAAEETKEAEKTADASAAAEEVVEEEGRPSQAVVSEAQKEEEAPEEAPAPAEAPQEEGTPVEAAPEEEEKPADVPAAAEAP